MSTELPPDLKSRILAAAAREPEAPRAGPRTAATAAGIVVWLALALTVLGVRPDLRELPALVSWGTGVVLALASALFLGLTTTRGPRMLGPRVEWALAALWLLPLGLAAWVTEVAGEGPSSMPCPTRVRALELSPPCLVASLVLALPIAAALIRLRRAAPGASPALTGALAGAAAATLVHALMHAHCPIAHPLHALVGHLLPLLPTALLSAALAHRLR